jgi:hypothetical protein
MTTQQAKSIPLTEFLHKLGYMPDTQKGNANDIWYKSPFRPQEQTASFHIHKAKNIWFDFGYSKGGNILDFVMELKKADLSASLAFIEQINRKPLENSSYQQNNVPNETLNKLENPYVETFVLNHVTNDFAPSLVRYMQQERRINVDAAKEFITQVHFSNKAGKPFFGIGMKNIANGYEIRNPYFKSCVGKKDLIFIKGKGQGSIAIFEGMFDFFSAITYFGKATFLENDILILNSAGFQEQAIRFLKDQPHYKTLSLFLDNDEAGQTVADNLKAAFPNKILEPSYALYLPHKDFNEFLIARSRYK